MARRYTQSDVLLHGRRFLEAHGRLPKRADLHHAGLPSYSVIVNLFGDWWTWLACIEDPSRKPRKCLRCDEDFMSTGAHNRICGLCKESDDWRINDAWLGNRISRQVLYGGRVTPPGANSEAEALREVFGHDGWHVCGDDDGTLY